MKTFDEILEEVAISEGHSIEWIETRPYVHSKGMIATANKKYAEQAAMKVLEGIAIEINTYDSPVVRDLNKFISEYKIVLP